MKIGEEYICIKDVINFYCGSEKICNIKGKTYKIAIESRFMNDGEYVYISSDKNTTSKGYLGFFVSGSKHYYKDWDNFKDHFVTKQKARKLKLKKIYENWGQSLLY